MKKKKKKERKRENESKNKEKESPFLFTLRSKIVMWGYAFNGERGFKNRARKKKEKRKRETERKGWLESIEGGNSPSCGGHEDLIDEERRFPWWRSAAAWKVR